MYRVQFSLRVFLITCVCSGVLLGTIGKIYLKPIPGYAGGSSSIGDNNFYFEVSFHESRFGNLDITHFSFVVVPEGVGRFRTAQTASSRPPNSENLIEIISFKAFVRGVEQKLKTSQIGIYMKESNELAAVDLSRRELEEIVGVLKAKEVDTKAISRTIAWEKIVGFRNRHPLTSSNNLKTL